MLSSYAMTDVGRTRTVNQDYVFSCLEPIGNLPNLFIVADGMGGHQAGFAGSRWTMPAVPMRSSLCSWVSR